MKKIISIAVLATLCSAPLMHGMAQRTYNGPSANYKALISEHEETLTPAWTPFTSSPTENSTKSRFEKHLRTGLWGAAGTATGIFALYHGIKGIGITIKPSLDRYPEENDRNYFLALTASAFSKVFYSKALQNYRSK